MAHFRITKPQTPKHTSSSHGAKYSINFSSCVARDEIGTVYRDDQTLPSHCSDLLSKSKQHALQSSLRRKQIALTQTKRTKRQTLHLIPEVQSGGSLRQIAFGNGL